MNSKSPWGYFALAESLQERQQYQTVIDVLLPAVGEMRSRAAAEPGLSLLLPHIGYVIAENYAVVYAEAVADILAWAEGTPIRLL